MNTPEPITNFDLFVLFLPIAVVALLGGYWSIRYNDSLPIPDEEALERERIDAEKNFYQRRLEEDDEITRRRIYGENYKDLLRL